MRFDILTLFPQFFDSPLQTSILGRAIRGGALQVGLHNIRDWALDKHRMADDTPFGGGAGMVLKAEPIARALEDLLNFEAGFFPPPCPVIHLTPQGRTLNQKMVEEFAAKSHLVLLCGHYEGIDERLVQSCVTHEVSLGDFVLTGGEGAALILLEAVARWVPKVLGNSESACRDSFANGLLEAPPYTRPSVWRGQVIPEILLSGDHGAIARWRFLEGLKRTLERRPELADDLTIETALEALAPSKRQKQELLTHIRELQKAAREKHETGLGETRFPP